MDQPSTVVDWQLNLYHHLEYNHRYDTLVNSLDRKRTEIVRKLKLLTIISIWNSIDKSSQNQ